MIQMYSYQYKERISQGDIFENVKIPIGIEVIDGETYEKKRTFPYAIVMTQDCDLEQDFNNRKIGSDNQRNRILSILVCPVFLADKVKEGIHLEDVKLQMKGLNSKLWNPIKKNNDERYYFLKEDKVSYGPTPDDLIIIPELIIDFKHYQTILREELYKLYKNQYFVSINPLFREQISDRFTHYLGRIGLPEKSEQKSGYSCRISADFDSNIFKSE